MVRGRLIYTFDIGTPAREWAGYQVIAGLGLRLAIQTPQLLSLNQSAPERTSPWPGRMCCIRVYKRKLQKTNNCCHVVFQFVGGSFGVSCAQAIFNNGIIKSSHSRATCSTRTGPKCRAYDLHGAFSGDQAFDPGGRALALILILSPQKAKIKVTPGGTTLMTQACLRPTTYARITPMDEKQKDDSPT